MKILCLTFVCAFIVSCNQQNQAQTDNCPAQNNVSAPPAAPVIRSILEIPWADPALVAKVEGC